MAYSTFASFILFKEMAVDDLGHLYRAGEVKGRTLARTVWLRVLDGRAVPRKEVAARLPVARRLGEVLQSGNVTARPQYLEHNGVPAIAWEYVAGQPLSKVFATVCHEGFPVPVDNALLIIEKIALGLAAGLTVELEGSSLVHGFLHPGMVVVTTDGEAMLAGFGLGEELLGTLDDPAAGAAFAPYLAPEVLDGRSASKRGDVYSLGAILYQLLSGEALPADPAARVAALEQATLAYDEAPLPADIVSVLRRALAPRPEDRFSSAADFKKELDKLLYGGAYSPTTFNLALFMDRLFRGEIEAEERERLSEAEVDPTPLMAPPAPEPVEEPVAPPARGGRGLLLGGLAAIVLVGAIVAGVVLVGGGPDPVALPPTPTAEEVAAERAAQQKAVEALVQEQVAALMAEREEDIRSELSTRQAEIEALQRRLNDAQDRSAARSDADAQREAEAIKRQLAAAEAAQEEQEAALQAERERRLEEVRQKLAAATPTAVPTAAVIAAQMPQEAHQAAAPTPAAPTTAPPTAVAAAAAATKPPLVVTENMWVEPTLVDTPPAAIKDYDPVWPRVAFRSRERGVVIMRATVNASGRVEEVEILRADTDGFGIAQAARDAVFKYLFRPATKNGVKVKSSVTVTTRYAFTGR